jgi:hypothetical protein
MRRAKSLVESSSHSATLALLESKLGGKPSADVDRPLPSVPGASAHTTVEHSVQTSDMLKRHDESIYASAIVRGMVLESLRFFLMEMAHFCDYLQTTDTHSKRILVVNLVEIVLLS